MNRRLQIILAVLGIMIAAFAVYANSFGNEFVFDDVSQIADNTVIRSFANLPAVFTRHLTYFSDEHQKEGKFYRPLQTLTLMTDYLLWGKEPLGYHITNTILHLLVGVLLLFFLVLITGNVALSFLVALLYVVHPVHTEAVTYMSGRADSLCAIFLLLMCLFQEKYRKALTRVSKVFYYTLIMSSFLMALLSKELAVIFPFLLMLCEYCLRDEGAYSPLKPRRALFYLPLFAIMGVWFIVKNAVVATETMVTHPASLATRLVTVPRLIMDYARLSFLPTGLHMEYKLPFPRSIFQSGYFEGLIFIVFFIGVFYYAWREGRRDRDYRIIFFGLAWFFVGLLPYLNIVFQLNAPFAEHWLYISEMGFILAVVSLCFYYARNNAWAKRVVLAGCVIAAAAYSIMTVRQNLVWKDPMTFYTYTIKYAPYSSTTYNNLAVEYIERGDLLYAEELLEKALALDPDYGLAKENLSNLKDLMRQKGLR